MRRTLIGLSVVALGIGLGLGLSGCTGNMVSAKTTVTQTVAHIPGAAVDVNTRNGRIEVVATESATEVTIEARIKCVGRTQTEANDRLARTTLDIGRDTSRTLMIRPVFADGARSGDGVSFIIHLPDAEDLTLDTSNGGIVVKGTSGDLVADTSNGAVLVEGHHGPTRIDTSNGRIEIVDGHGPIEADTSNGRITVTLADDQAGPVQLDTSNGRISMTVGPAFAGRVSMSTSNGSVKVHDHTGRVVSSELERTRGRVVIGDGEHESKLDTSNGSIELTIDG